MSGEILSNTKAVWSLGLLAFVSLCCICIFWHAPQSGGLESASDASVATTVVSATLEARLFNGKVTLTGALPDSSAKTQVLGRAKDLYGEGNFVDNLKVNNQTAFPSARWFNSVLALLPFANQVNNEGGIAMNGNSAIVRGLVETDDIKSKLMSAATTAAGSSIRVEDKVMVQGKVTAAQATDFQAKLNQMIAGKIVEFDTNSDVLTDKGKLVLDEMVKVLSEAPGIPVEVSGHTDARGDAALNENLSQRRARTCLRYLAQKGVAARRLSSQGYGSSKPIADNDTAEGQQRNRRIEFTVLNEGK